MRWGGSVRLSSLAVEAGGGRSGRGDPMRALGRGRPTCPRALVDAVVARLRFLVPLHSLLAGEVSHGSLLFVQCRLVRSGRRCREEEHPSWPKLTRPAFGGTLASSDAADGAVTCEPPQFCGQPVGGLSHSHEEKELHPTHWCGDCGDCPEASKMLMGPSA